MGGGSPVHACGGGYRLQTRGDNRGQPQYGDRGPNDGGDDAGNDADSWNLKKINTGDRVEIKDFPYKEELKKFE